MVGWYLGWAELAGSGKRDLGTEVEAAVADGLGHVGSGDRHAVIEIGDGAREPPDLGVGPRRQAQAIDGASDERSAVRIERGDPLEPPPPSWRRWVKRQFHGVARDFMRDEDYGR